MEIFKDNPLVNVLAAGLTEEKLNHAALKSGYPLQTRVTSDLRNEFSVYEEWSYIDDKTNELRTIDLLAQKHLSEYGDMVKVFL